MKVRWCRAAVTGRLLHWPSAQLSFRPLFLLRIVIQSASCIIHSDFKPYKCVYFPRSLRSLLFTKTSCRFVLVKVGCKLKFTGENGRFLVNTRSEGRWWPILAERRCYPGCWTGNTCSEWKWQLAARQIWNGDRGIVWHSFWFVVSCVRSMSLELC